MTAFRRRFLDTVVNNSDYATNILTLSPLAYYKSIETSGTVMIDSSGNGYHGTWTGVTLADTTGPGASMGSAPLYDGTTDFGLSAPAGLLSGLSKTVGTLSVWCKVSGSAVWTDGAGRVACTARIDSTNNYVRLNKASANNTARGIYAGNAVQVLATQSNYSNTNWFNAIVTWDTSGSGLSLYIDNVVAQTSSITTVMIGSFADVLLGAQESVPLSLWSGYLAHAAIFARVVTSAERVVLATAI